MVGSYIQYPFEVYPVKVLVFRSHFLGRLDVRYLFSQLHLYDDMHLLPKANSF
jgi:hypothetical protein